MPKSKVTTEISKYIFLEGAAVKFVIHKIDLVPTKELYTNLEVIKGKDTAEIEYQAAIEDEASPPSFIVGLGRTEGRLHASVYALTYSELTCFIGNDIYLKGILLDGKNSILYSASGYSDTNNGDPEVEESDITLNIDSQNEQSIQLVIDAFNASFSLELDDECDEFIQLAPDLCKALNKFKQFENVYTYEWDDLDDLLGLSKVWPFSLSFEALNSITPLKTN